MVSKIITVIIMVLLLALSSSCNPYNACQSLIYCKKGNALFAQGKDDEALKCFDKAIELTPKLKEAWTYKGIILSDKKQYDEALKCYDKAIEIAPGYTLGWSNKGDFIRNETIY
jgi:tetratricopeptide (TPR) repeat protein